MECHVPKMPSHHTTFVTARWLFPRLLGLLYLIAFASWGVQMDGLCGEDGILPTGQLIENLHAYEARTSESVFLHYPTVFLWHYSDGFAQTLTWTCCGLAVLVMLGAAQGPLLFILWACYLSIAATGDLFMGYQWDALLLEAGFLAIFFAPWKLISTRRNAPPPWGTTFLLHWLLFRLMLESGFVKIAGGDEVWTNLTALQFHYETQPIPNPLAWWVHNLPDWIHSAGCAFMHVVELALPFAIFLGRWGRLSACLGTIGLMIGVLLTGNFNFFNLLTIALALTLIDDRQWSRLRKRAAQIPPPSPNPWRTPTRWACLILCSLLVTESVLAAHRNLSARVPCSLGTIPESWIDTLYRPIAGFRSINAYGLFQDMTTERPEIEIEVSDDGLLWLPIEFKWKPGPRDRLPGQCAPHQPRLDWQMWFAALYPGFDPQRDSQSNSPVFWFGQFLSALLQHKQPVWDLLGEPPFPIKDIRHIRAKLYRYEFTTPEQRQSTGHVWKRTLLGNYSPSFTIPPD